MSPAPSGCADLTGVTRYRDGWFGKIILQVEERYMPANLHGIDKQVRWRDARERDLRMLEYLLKKRNEDE